MSETNTLPSPRKKIDQEAMTALIEENLFPGNEATTDMVFQVCKHLASYNTVAQLFRAIMRNLIEQGRAVKMVNGKYLILKNK